MSDDINIGAISEALNNKLDISCMNANPATTPAGLNTHNMPVIITTYVNGTSGYRIWADGFCEQWGYATTTSEGYNNTVTFIKQYRDANYNLYLQAKQSPSYSDDLACASYKSKTPSSFLYACGQKGTTWAIPWYIDWRACGYLAPDQY